MHPILASATRTRVPLHAPVLAVPLIVTATVFWPGHMNLDTLAQLEQVMGGWYTNQHAPLLMALWHPFWNLGAGPGCLLVAQVAGFLTGAYLILRAGLAPYPAAIAASGVAFAPQVFGELALLGRDVWFTALLMLMFGCLIRAASSQQRRWWLIAAVVFGWMALAARQNAVFAVIVPAGIAVMLSMPSRSRLLIALVTVTTVAVAAGSQTAAQHALHVTDVHPEQYVYLRDLTAISHQKHENLLPPVVLPGRDTTVIDAHWGVDSVNSYITGPQPPIHVPLKSVQVRDLADQWRTVVTSHPLEYLHARATFWLREISLTTRPVWIYHPRVDPNPWNLQPRFPSLDHAGGTYVRLFADDQTLDGTLIHAAWIYLLITIAGAVVLLGRADVRLRIVGAFAVSLIAYQTGLFAGATSTQFRFEFPLVAGGLLCGVVCIATAASRPSRR